MAKFLLLLLHNLLFPFALLGMAPSALKKMKARGGTVQDLWQRFGWFKPEQREQLQRMRERGPVLWVHAASVGEVGIACKLIREMLKASTARPLQFVVTTTTPTGFAQVQAMPEARASAEQVVLPLYSALDGWFIVRRFLRHLRPQQLILVEAEVWPNLTFACQRAAVPVSLVNARLSPRSERRFRKFLPFSRAIFRMLRQVMVQEPEDVTRWQSLGVAADRVKYTGSIKFDPGVQGQQRAEDKIAVFEEILRELGWGAQDPVMLLASTHAGEEVALAEVFQQLRQHRRGRDLRLIIVPRHVERSDELQIELQKAGFEVVRRSFRDTRREEWPGVGAANVLLVDTTGELGAWQYLASMVVVGKSFLARGGQNPAEAIMAGKPVIFGPNMENFEILVQQLLRHEGARQCASLKELETTLAEFLEYPERGEEMAKQGMSVLEKHAGATLKTAGYLLQDGE